MNIVIYIIMILTGLLQLAAMLDGLTDVLGGFFGFIAALILGQIPIIGTILGIRGAIVNWGWPVLRALGLFLAPLLLSIVIGLFNSRDKHK